MEYMASGTPLVAYDLPCIPREYIPYFYQITSKEQMSDLLNELLFKNKEELHAFGEKAQNWITSNKNAITQASKVVRMLKPDKKG